MAKNKVKTSPPSTPSRWREVVGVLLTAGGVYLFVSLVSYNPQDVSLNSTGSTGDAVTNMGGIVGAHVADVIAQLLGLSGFLIPFLLIFLGITRFFSRQWGGWLLRAGGGLCFLLSLCVLLQLKVGQTMLLGETVRDAGGIIGRLTAGGLVRFLAIPGATISVLAVLLASVLVMTNLSLRKAAGGVLVVFRGAGQLFTIRKERTRRHKAVTKAKAGEKKVKPKVAKRREGVAIGGRKPEPVQEEFEALPRPKGRFSLPPLRLLDQLDQTYGGVTEEEYLAQSGILERKLNEYGIQGSVTAVNPGPVITVFEYEPAPGVKINRIVNLTGDLSLALGGRAIRVVPHIPGKSVVGIEVPNIHPEIVSLREILSSPEFKKSKGTLKLALGKDTSGVPLVTDLDSMPHLLIAGATGTGKSVAINSMILSLITNLIPDEVRLLMIDPKMLELSPYEGIPYLLSPVVMEPKKAASALRWLVAEMERRYQLLASHKARDIGGYNRRMAKLDSPPEGDDPHLPHIVVIIDELADLMMSASRDIEECIARLGQMARAAGIHLVIATQRPSVDIISGNIKTNITCRIAFKVFDKANSRVILDENGAEQLLGRGDMLFTRPGMARMIRGHGSMVTDDEVNRVVRFLKDQGKPEYRDDLFDYEPQTLTRSEEDQDEKYDEVLDFVFLKGFASASMIQRNFKVGYNRAARMVEKMEAEGIIGPPDGAKPRPVLKRVDFE
jgi:S-DNA-T family DNA segregation ATPase FtsK/SpoIIIE